MKFPKICTGHNGTVLSSERWLILKRSEKEGRRRCVQIIINLIVTQGNQPIYINKYSCLCLFYVNMRASDATGWCFRTGNKTTGFDYSGNDPFLTRVRAQVSFEGGVAGERPLAVAADVAVHACVDLHVLLQGLLGLEALRTQQTEHRHVSPWRTHKTQTRSYFSTIHRQGPKWGNWVTSTLCASSEGKASFKGASAST